MELAVALGTYVGVLLGSFFLLLSLGYTFFGATLLALIIALIYLNIAFPMTRSELDDVDSLTVLYSFIQVFTLVVVVIYALIRLVPEKRSRAKFPLVSV
jgi:uncharacterized BrkB/YihY/UPF0761 family membrane protein